MHTVDDSQAVKSVLRPEFLHAERIDCIYLDARTLYIHVPSRYSISVHAHYYNMRVVDCCYNWLSFVQHAARQQDLGNSLQYSNSF